MFSDKLMELAYLCKCQQELVEAILEVEKWERNQPWAYIDTEDSLFILQKSDTRWSIINTVDNKVVKWVKLGKGDFARLMTKWLSLNGYETI